jgi:copper oxidase (laccase) domain-containing protein
VPGKFYLNTWQANADQLAGAGVPRAQIHVSGLCTACYPELLHSYRVDGARAGRMAGAIRRRS